MYYLYILKCADKTLYTGITTDLARRVGEHNNSKLGSKYTSARRPVKLAYFQKFKDRSGALKAEARIKKLKKSEKLNLIKYEQNRARRKNISGYRKTNPRIGQLRFEEHNR